MPKKQDVTAVFLSVRNRLTNIVSRIVPPREVEDIVQETYVRLCQVKKIEEMEQPHSFMMKTARNLALDFAKRSESRLTMTAENIEYFELGAIDELYDETSEKAASEEEFILFCEAVRSLPQQCRRVFVLKKVYGYTQREIARKLGISENTVEKHAVLGLKRCTAYLIEQEVRRGKEKPSSRRLADGGRNE